MCGHTYRIWRVTWNLRNRCLLIAEICSDLGHSTSPMKLEKLEIPAMLMKNFAAKLQRLSGYMRIVRKYLFHSYGVLDLLVAKVYGSSIDIVLDYMKSNVCFIQFTKPQNTPLGLRVLWSIKRSIMWFLGCSLPCPYICHQRLTMLESGYLVMDYIGNSDVQMLSETWDEHRHQQDKRTNLFKGLSRIMLSLSRVPLPRIGSWTLDSNGALRLSNRPLTLRLHQLENSGISTNISRSLTYSVADAYYLDLLSCHDSRIRNQPNSVSDADDGRAQIARLTTMKALLPHLSKREHREGPFFYRLTDLHPSNIFVGSQWNVK